MPRMVGRFVPLSSVFLGAVIWIAYACDRERITQSTRPDVM
jgi:hypothetical protein